MYTAQCDPGLVGAIAQWLECWVADRAVWVRALDGLIALCSWTRHFTLTVPLFALPRCIKGYWQIISCGKPYDGLASRVVKSNQEPVTTPYSCHGFFTDRSIFSLNSDANRTLSDQLQSQARANVDMSTWCRHVYVRPHCLTLPEACSWRVELAYFAGKISTGL